MAVDSDHRNATRWQAVLMGNAADERSREKPVQPSPWPRTDSLLGHGCRRDFWIVHGYFRFMTPGGPDSVWREDLGYSPIVSSELFLLYNVPGVLALLLTAWATLSYLSTFRTHHAGLKRAARILALVAFVFGVIAAVGLVVLLFPRRRAGSAWECRLGLALFLTGLGVVEDGTESYGHPRRSGPLLMLLGVIGMLTPAGAAADLRVGAAAPRIRDRPVCGVRRRMGCPGLHTPVANGSCS